MLSYHGYGGYAERYTTYPDGRDMLDPIDIAGTANVLRLKKTAVSHGLQYAIVALSIICSCESFISLALKDESQKLVSTKRTTPAKWAEHLELLANWKVVGCCKKQDVKFTGKYFEVYKKPPITRSIFDGRVISAACRTPPPVNLAEIGEQLGFLHEHHLLNLVTCDLRHFFHQLPLHEQIQKFFGLRLDKRERGCEEALWYRYLVLPMGWSWSPFISQCTTFTVLAAMNFFDANPTLATTPPRFLKRTVNGKVVAVAFVLYDNILVGTSTPELALLASKRLQDQLHWHSVTEKFLKVASETELTAEDWSAENAEHGAVHLGVQLGVTKTGQRRWRHIPEKLAVWETAGKTVGNIMKIRDVARLVGIAVWDATVRGEGLIELRKILQIASMLGRYASQNTWSSSRDMSEEEQFILGSTINNILLNQERVHRKQVIFPSTIYLASDTSDAGWGWLQLKIDEEGANRAIDPVSMEFVGKDRELHIFIKELKAAVWCLKLSTQRYGNTLGFCIVTDNTAVAAVLRRGFSTSGLANSLLTELPHWLFSQLRVVTVPSAKNPADAPSRGGIPIEKKQRRRWWGVVTECIEVVKKQIRGEGIEYDLMGNRRPQYGGTRHEEKDADRLHEPIDEFWQVAEDANA